MCISICQAIFLLAYLVVYSAFVVYVNWWLYKMYVFAVKRVFGVYNKLLS